jgi:hypothetical protein
VLYDDSHIVEKIQFINHILYYNKAIFPSSLNQFVETYHKLPTEVIIDDVTDEAYIKDTIKYIENIKTKHGLIEDLSMTVFTKNKTLNFGCKPYSLQTVDLQNDIIIDLYATKRATKTTRPREQLEQLHNNRYGRYNYRLILYNWNKEELDSLILYLKTHKSEWLVLQHITPKTLDPHLDCFATFNKKTTLETLLYALPRIQCFSIDKQFIQEATNRMCTHKPWFGSNIVPQLSNFFTNIRL